MLAFNDRAVLNRAELLRQIDDSPAFDPISVVAILQDSLHDEDPLVREQALRSLTLRDSSETPTLAEAELPSIQGEDASLARVHFAAKNDDRASLRELILTGDAPVQEAAFDALAQQDQTAAIEVLRAELNNPNSLHRLQTLELLARSPYTSSSQDLSPMLEQAQQDVDPLVRSFAKHLLDQEKAEAALHQEP